jgi:hypothetical protein
LPACYVPVRRKAESGGLGHNGGVLLEFLKTTH